ncbi:hypothetical protein M0P65_05520 [Candidatus Gracilibacteria bacterium]|nr:hypothetical protein [Candidatus Gracilibacteria bacterium]
MKLINLTNKDVKFSINDDGTIAIKIGVDYLLKISWAELRSLDMIISKQQSEALGLAKDMIEKIEKALDNSILLENNSPTITTETFTQEQKKRFSKFLNSIETEMAEVFPTNEITKIIGKEFLIEELKENFGKNYSFKSVGNDEISISFQPISIGEK